MSDTWYKKMVELPSFIDALPELIRGKGKHRHWVVDILTIDTPYGARFLAVVKGTGSR